MEILGIIIAMVMLVLNLIGIIWLGIAIGHWFWTLVAYGVILGITFNIKKGYPGIIVLGIGALITLVVIIVCIVKAVNERKSEKQQKELNNTLLNSVKEGNKQTVQELIEKGGNVNYIGYVSSDKKSLLEIAVENNDKEMVTLLIEKGANVNLENGGITPLDCTENEEIIALLKSHGAKTKEEIEQELKEEQARKEEEERKEAERKKKEELEKETKYYQDLLIQRNKKIECNECKTELDKFSKVCPTCGKKIATVVGKDNECDFSTIQEALDSVEDGAIIKVKPGVYNEHLDFNKSVHLIGCSETIINKSSEELPIVVLDSDKLCIVDIPVKIEGIVFTHKKDLEFDSVSSFLKTSSEIKKVESTDSKSMFGVSADSCFINIAILCSEGFGVCIFDKKAIFDISYLHQITYDGIVIYNNATPSINNCIVSNSNFSGICCRDKSSPKICNCEIHNHGAMFGQDECTSGIVICGESSAKIYSCKVYNNMGIGLTVAENANPSITSCSIFGQNQGVSVECTASGIYEDCSIYSNIKCGLGICDEAKPTINNCKFFSNGQHGIIIVENAYLNMNNSEISNNGRNYAGVLCRDSSRVVIKNCKSFGVHTCGVALFENAAGNFENCEFNWVQEESNYVSNFVNCRTK